MTKRKNNRVEVSDITEEGCWLHIFAKKYFAAREGIESVKKLYLSFRKYPYFLGASHNDIKNITLVYDELHWKSLGIDLGICDIERFEYEKDDADEMYLLFTKEQLKRLRRYNEEQIAKGGTPWHPDLINELGTMGCIKCSRLSDER